jgi:hypothetical protein
VCNIGQVPFHDNDVEMWIDRQKANRNVTNKQLINELTIKKLGLFAGNVYKENIDKIIAKLQAQDNQPMALDGGKKRRKTRKSKKSKRKTHKRK